MALGGVYTEPSSLKNFCNNTFKFNRVVATHAARSLGRVVAGVKGYGALRESPQRV